MSAPKQLAKRQKLERKRRRKREMALKRQRKQPTGWCRPDGFGPVTVVNGPVQGTKMSTVLEDFVAPLLDSVDGRAAHERLFLLAQTAWNVAIEPEYRREAMINDIVENSLPSESSWEREACRELLDWLVARKLRSFANCRRPILAFHLDELEDGGYYLSVVSGLSC